MRISKYIILTLLICLVLPSELFASTASSYKLNLTWTLKYGIFLSDASIRGERPEGYVSNVIARKDETKLELQNFYCVKAIRETVCPVVFYDKNGKVIGYATFKKQDSPSDYSVDIPSACRTYQFSSENVYTLNPTVTCNRDAVKAAAADKKENESKRSLYSSKIESSYNALIKKAKSRDIIYEMPLNTTEYDVTKDLSSSEKLSSVISQMERKYSGKTICLNLPEQYTVLSTETLSSSRNKYIIQSAGTVTSLSPVKAVSIKNGVLTLSRPYGLNSIETVLVNGHEYTLSGDYSQEDPDRMPSFKSGNIKTVKESKDSYIYRIPLDDVSHFAVGSYVKIFSEWVCQISQVKAVGRNSIDVESHTPFGNTLLKYDYPVNLYCVRNNRSLAAKGEFWYDDSKIYCKLASEDSIVKEVKIPVCSTFFKVVNSSDIIFKDIIFEYSSSKDIFSYYEQGAINLDGCIAVENSSNIHVIDCEFYRIADECVSIRYNSEKCSVQGCYMHEVGCGGIAVNNSKMPWEKGYVKDDTHSILIANNIVARYGRIDSGAAGIIVGYGNNVSVIANHVFDGYYTGISVGWGWNQYHLNKNTYVAGNVVHHIMKFLMCDGGGIYTLSNWDGGSIEGNTIYCVNTRSRIDCCYGIYHDEGSSSIVDYANLVYACDLGNGSCVADGAIINNIYAYIGDYAIHVMKDSKEMTTVVSRNLIYSCKNMSASSESALSEATMTRWKDNVLYNLSIGPDTKADTYNVYGWKFVLPSFKNPKEGDFTLNNSKELKTAVGFSSDRTVGLDGHKIPVFTSKFSDKVDMSEEDLRHYAYLYKSMSLNKNNPFFD